jgi:hypothetical protein
VGVAIRSEAFEEPASVEEVESRVIAWGRGHGDEMSGSGKSHGQSGADETQAANEARRERSWSEAREECSDIEGENGPPASTRQGIDEDREEAEHGRAQEGDTVSRGAERKREPPPHDSFEGREHEDEGPELEEPELDSPVTELLREGADEDRHEGSEIDHGPCLS